MGVSALGPCAVGGDLDVALLISRPQQLVDEIALADLREIDRSEVPPSGMRCGEASDPAGCTAPARRPRGVVLPGWRWGRLADWSQSGRRFSTQQPVSTRRPAAPDAQAAPFVQPSAEHDTRSWPRGHMQELAAKLASIIASPGSDGLPYAVLALPGPAKYLEDVAAQMMRGDPLLASLLDSATVFLLPRPALREGAERILRQWRLHLPGGGCEQCGVWRPSCGGAPRVG